MGCGRTDTGVHARQFYAHFESDIEIVRTDVIHSLNSMLPEDIVLTEILIPKETDAHARYDAVSRKYIYKIMREPDPFQSGLAWHYSGNLDLQNIQNACDLLLQTEDFEALSKINKDLKHYKCELNEAQWIEDGNILELHISANRFVRSMIRIIVGTMILIGKNKLSVSQLKEALEKRDRSMVGKAAPPQGLYLHSVVYPKNYFVNE